MIPLHDNNPTSIKPLITVAFLLTCLGIFIWQFSLETQAAVRAIYTLGMIPAVLLQQASLPAELVVIPAWLSLFTSMFMHGDWLHLISNMLYLWVFGNNVEDAMGHGRFILFYLLCGVFAALAQALPDPASQIPMVGASGAISGILGAYLLLYPRSRILVVIPLGVIMFTQRIAAIWVLLFWFGMQLVSSVYADNEQGGVAFGAHIGGFVAGMVLIAFFKHRHVRLFAPARH